MSRSMVRRLWCGPYVRWCSLVADGALVGILILWDSRVLELVDSCVSNFSLSLIFKNVEDGMKWIFFKVYGLNDDDLLG